MLFSDRGPLAGHVPLPTRHQWLWGPGPGPGPISSQPDSFTKHRRVHEPSLFASIRCCTQRRSSPPAALLSSPASLVVGEAVARSTRGQRQPPLARRRSLPRPRPPENRGPHRPTHTTTSPVSTTHRRPAQTSDEISSRHTWEKGASLPQPVQASHARFRPWGVSAARAAEVGNSSPPCPSLTSRIRAV